MKRSISDTSGDVPWRAARGAPSACRAILMLGVPVDDVTMEESVDRMFALAAHGRSAGLTHQVATVNVDFIVNALLEPDLAELLRATSLAIPDGMPIVWGSSLLRTPIRTRVAGADLVPALVERAASAPIRVLLYGAGPGIAVRAAELLRSRYPGADVVGLAGPDFADLADLGAADLRPIREVDPDICCVAFGNPKQERFISTFGSSLGVPVMIGVGGTLDFLVGEQVRAPLWMQRFGLEWLHRALSDPRRLARRYVRDARVFIPALLAQAWSGRSSRQRGTVDVHPTSSDHWRVDLSALDAADNRVASELVTLLRSAGHSGVTVSVTGVSDRALEPVFGLAEVLRRS